MKFRSVNIFYILLSKRIHTKNCNQILRFEKVSFLIFSKGSQTEIANNKKKHIVITNTTNNKVITKNKHIKLYFSYKTLTLIE